MELIEALKNIYADSDKSVLIADSDMKVLWSNDEKLDSFSPDKLRLSDGSSPMLPVAQTVTLEYQGAFGEARAVEIMPLQEGNLGYLLRFFSCDDIERLSDRSGHLKFKTNFLGNIRSELSNIVFLLDANRQRFVDKGDLDYLKMDSEAREHILRTFSATANLNELTKYYSGFYRNEAVNISAVLSGLCENLTDRFKTDDAEFTYDIEPMMYSVTNEDRLRAAVSNLLVNAFMYCPSRNKLIRLEAKKEDGIITVTVRNSGAEVAQSELEGFRKPFEAFRGFGDHESLGIAVASLYCKSHSGMLCFECVQGEYTKAIMQLPMQSCEMPNRFRIENLARIESPYDLQYCILAKGLELRK